MAESCVEHVRDADSAHIEETSWKLGRDKAWLWVVVTRLVTVFSIATSLGGGGVAKGLLETDRRKVVISDRFKSYTWIKRRQFAGRSSIGISRRWSIGWPVHRGRSAPAGALRAAVRLVAPGAGPDDGPGHAAGQRGRHTVLVPEQPAPRALLRPPRTVATCRQLLAGETQLWTSVRVEGVGPTNNHAERARRHGVI
jgi:hypothetical protein